MYISVLVALFGLLLSGSVYAENLDYNVLVKPSLSLELSSPTVSFHLNPASNVFNTGDLDITVATNNINGYKLYISTVNGSGSTSGTELTNTTNSTYTIPTLESNTTESNFPVNKWGYRISSGTNTNPDITDTTTGLNSRYFPYISNTLINSSDSTTNNNTATLTFAAKADYNKPAGVYDISLNFKTIPQVSQTYMQDMNTATTRAICNTESPTIVIDSRDEQPYLIQRLDDSKCWMLDNLNLDLTDPTIVANLSSENTNANAASLKSLREGNRTDCGEADCSRYAMSGLTYENWMSGTPYAIPFVNREGTCSTSSQYKCKYNGSYISNTVLSTLVSNSTFGLGSGKIGVYYNYCAASAGSYCYDTDDAPADFSVNVDYDICPASWRLPTGGSEGEYKTLCDVITDSSCAHTTDMVATDSDSLPYKLSASLTGGYDSPSATTALQGYVGHFWSSTHYDPQKMYDLIVEPLFIRSTYNNHRRNTGRSVRCLLQE